MQCISQQKGNDTTGPYVNLGAVVSRQLFWGGILKGAPPVGQSLALVIQQISSKAKVNDLQLAELVVVFQQNIF